MAWAYYDWLPGKSLMMPQVYQRYRDVGLKEGTEYICVD